MKEFEEEKLTEDEIFIDEQIKYADQKTIYPLKEDTKSFRIADFYC